MKKIYNNLYDDLNTYSYNNFSQNGEDGILEEIFNRLEIFDLKSVWCVEFGAWDGIYLSNTFNIVKKGCNAIYIEGNKIRFKELLKTQKKYPKIIAINEEVSHKRLSKKSLDNILKKTKIPKDFDILSIDIDSFDLLIWESFINYQPKVVVIEINSSYPPGIKKWHSNKYKNANGNSFSATLKVGENKGYKLVVHSGNMIFVRNDLLNKIKIDLYD